MLWQFIVSRAEEGRAERKDAATVAGASADPFAEGQRDQRLVVTVSGRNFGELERCREARISRHRYMRLRMHVLLSAT